MTETTPPIAPRVLDIPSFAMVVLVGVSGSGKSTFASRHFLPTECLSSDAFRGWVSDDENSLDATTDAFDALHYLAGVRLRRRKLVVVDATNVQSDSRKPLLELAFRHDALAVAIVLNVKEELCHTRNRDRPGRDFGPHVVRNQSRNLRQSLRNLKREGFRYVYVLDGPEEIDAVQIERRPVWTDRSNETGPFDIIGDIHGCAVELIELLDNLGYRQVDPAAAYTHPDGRRAIFLGDLVDRGPRVVDAVRIVQRMVAAGTAFCVPGNHDVKLMRCLQGKSVQITHGLGESLAQIEALPDDEREEFKKSYITFADSLVSHFLLDGGKLVVAHAGMKETYQGRSSGRVRDFAIWGDTTGETDEFGLPVRYPWADEYRGLATVVYGHTPIPEAEWLNNTINIDTGCVFGGSLTALRYPERELVQVASKETYAVPAKPFVSAQSDQLPDAEHPIPNTEHRTPNSDLLSAQDVIGKRIVSTPLAGSVTIRAENAAAAFEVMSRFAVDPRWLIYLPPTMSPSETTKEPGYLEYPREAFAYYRENGIPSVVCQTKHMGSRAVVVICKDEEAAFKRFGIRDAVGECYTRTGRRFFADSDLHSAFIAELRSAISLAGLWDELETGWLCLDAELMPWNAKAQELLRDQYAAVGAAARLGLAAAGEVTALAVARGLPLHEMATALAGRLQNAERFVAAYGQYCWPVSGLSDLRLAPFHLLASQGKTYFDKEHEWHVAMLARLAEHSALCMATESRTVDVLNEEVQTAASDWWVERTSGGSEGMVVKPSGFVAKGRRGLAQPAVKVRGREYLRIIYGPEYTDSNNLDRLRKRGLSAKRSLAVREFALGVEGLNRFVRQEPLRRVHECVFGVLALESEPVDPRL